MLNGHFSDSDGGADRTVGKLSVTRERWLFCTSDFSRKKSMPGSGFLSVTSYIHDWPDSEMHDSLAFCELRNGAKTKAGPLEAEQLSRLGNIALVR